MEGRRGPSRAAVLAGVNAGLVGLLGVLVLGPRAIGQATPSISRAAGDYAFVGGEVSGLDTNAVYVLDAVNEELIVLRWDQSRKQLDTPDGWYRNLRLDTSGRPSR
jgi:hypothetical protein